MRLIKENKLRLILFLVIVFLFSACHYISEKQMLIGRWQYIVIFNNDSAIYQLVDSDFIDFEKDSFHYEIASVHKSCKGTWQYNNHILQLKYTLPDTIRFFEVEIISKSDLLFYEGKVHYRLKRQE